MFFSKYKNTDIFLDKHSCYGNYWVVKDNNRKNTMGYQIGRANWYLRTLFNKLLKEAGINLTNEQWTVLKVISTTPEISQTEIAERSLKDKTNVTRILDGLEKKKYIVRNRDERDRRMYRINITDSGMDILNKVDPLAEKAEEIVCSNFSENEVHQVKEILNSICNNIRDKI